MTEVPEHLLRRSKERRQAMGGGAGGDESPPAGGSPSTAVEPAAAASPAPAGGAAPPAAAFPVTPAYTGPPQLPPRKQRVPAWALPVLAALPLWAILYSGAFGERKSTDTSDPVVRGAIVYRADGCSGCHGVSGQGGVGPALTNVTKTFPNFADHIAWVKNGSAALKGQPYGATGKIATGGMPNHLDMPEADLIAVVCHERVTYGKQTPPPPECVVGAPAADSTTAAGG